ncbi:alpha/beta fold hydrolase [Goodfellowiella coeruleoviolacea]|uniref:Lysophospholipase, alpha-beta hydrolase superfamily n=1 Tax=Goodfellowiella coeruleoviolacea TaxID=334858 RepID=A0AAE3GKQ0_9PSEU|nr:alpha/beta fold hydrolase [Goodfellowiella coeruleoviolacea]MCP2169398.1 Lysophospholipase, alpha-beta hydrolase superfamily [Goodfellowiella coeruleoviolacea]
MAHFTGVIGDVHYRRWAPDQVRALAVFLHGLGEHTGSYVPFGTALNAAGIAVWAADHAGHGHSAGERVLIERIDDLIADAEQLVALARTAHPDLPLVVAGHSLGATVATLLTAERLLPAGVLPQGLVLTGASLVPPPEPARGLRELLATGIDPMDIRKDPGELTRDSAFAQQVRDDPLTWQGGIRPATVAALAAAEHRLASVVRRRTLTLPVLLVHGEDDDVAPAAGARAAARLLPNARAVIFPQDRHNILNELDRDEVYRVLVDFVLDVTGATSGRATAGQPLPEPGRTAGDA